MPRSEPCHREPVMRGGRDALLPRLTGGHQHQPGQMQPLRDVARQLQMSIMYRIKSAAQNANSLHQAFRTAGLARLADSTSSTARGAAPTGATVRNALF